MRWMSLLLVPVFAAFVLAQGEADPSKDNAKIQGKWNVVKATKGGKELPKEFRDEMKVTFSKDEVTIGNGTDNQAAKYELNSSEKPKHINIIPPKGGKVEGIYSLDGNSLKICWTKTKTRPKNFDSGEDVAILVLERAK